MQGIEPFNYAKSVAMLRSCFKGGNWFANPVKVPARQIVDAWPSEVKAKLDAASIKQGTPTDPWMSRR